MLTVAVAAAAVEVTDSSAPPARQEAVAADAVARVSMEIFQVVRAYTYPLCTNK